MQEFLSENITVKHAVYGLAVIVAVKTGLWAKRRFYDAAPQESQDFYAEGSQDF